MAAATQAEIDDLETALHSGVLTVRHKDGHTVTYRSMSEMREALDLARGSTTGRRRGPSIARFRRDTDRG